MIQRQDSLRDKLHQQVRLKYVHQKKIDEAIVPALQSRFNLHTQMRNSRRHSNIFHSFPCRTDYFKTSFLSLSLNLFWVVIAVVVILYFAMHYLN